MNLGDIRQKLENNIAAGKPLLAGTPIDNAAYYSDIGQVIEIDKFTLRAAEVTADDTQVCVEGRGDILQITDLQIEIGFEAVDDSMFLTFEADVDEVSAFGPLERFNSPLKAAVIGWRYGPLLSRDAPNWIPPISLAAFQARLGLPGIEAVDVTVHPPVFESEKEWIIRGNFAPVALPSLNRLLHWLDGAKVADLFPEKLTALGGITLRTLDIRFDPSAGIVTAVSLAFGMDQKSWSPGLGKLKLDDLLLSVDYTNTEKGKAAVTARVIGHLEVSAQSKMAFSLTHAGSTALSSLEIQSKDGLPIPGLEDIVDLIGAGDLVSHLPDVLRNLKEVLLRQLQVTFDGQAGKLGSAGIEVEVPDPIPLPGKKAHVENIDLQLNVEPLSTPPLQGELKGLVVAGGLMLPVDAVVAKDLELSAHLQSLDPRSIFAGLPDAFPQIMLFDVRAQLSTSGTLSFSAAIELNFRETARAFQIPLPVSMTNVHLSAFDATMNLADGSWTISASSDLEIRLIDTGAGQISLIAPQLTIAGGQNGLGFSSQFQLRGFMRPDPNVLLDCPQIECKIEPGSRKWSVTGNQVTLQLFGHPPYSGFSGDLSDEAISLTYAGGKKLMLVDWEGLGTVDLSNFTLFVRKSPTAGTGASDPPNSVEEWHFGVSGQASVNVAGLALPELQLDVTDQRLQAIADRPEFPPIVIDGWPAPAPRAELSFAEIALSYETGADNSASWRLDAEKGSLKFGNIPSMVQAYFYNLDGKCSFHVGDDGAWVKGEVGAHIPFPPLKFRLGKNTEIDLGQPTVKLDTVGLGFGESPFLSAGLTVGLPKRPQWIAGLLNDHCGFELKIARTLQLAVTSSPFSAIKDAMHRKDKPGIWWHAQLQDAGDYWIRVPEFEYGGQTWDLLVAVDSVGEPSLPLTPVIVLLEALGMHRDQLKYFPKSIPLSGLDLNSLNTLYDQVKRLLGGSMPAGFDSVIRQALAAISKGLSLMPADFQDYMVSSVPESFSLRMGVDPKGGAVIGLETQGDPLRFLFPSMLSGTPELVGIELRAFSMGTAAGGLLSIVTADGHVDRFDLPSIVSIIAVQDRDWSHSLRDRIYLENVFAIIPNEFPIPILMTYDHIGWDLKSWLGIGMHTHFYFPEEPLAMWNWIATAIPFFSDPDYHLHTKPHPRLAGEFTIGENYLTLPTYLGADPDKAYGLDHKLPALDVDRSLSFILDGLKFGNPGFILQSVPLYKGPESDPELLPFRINRSHIDFGPLSFDVAWCATTQDEFERVRNLPSVADALKAANNPDVLQSLPKAAQGPDYDKGFVLLFAEETAIHPIAGVKAQFGMALTGGGGFETGIQLTGTIAEHLSIMLRGDISVPPPPDSEVSLHGAFSIDWGETALIPAVDCYILVTDHSFEFQEDIRLKLHAEDCSMTGKLIIDAHAGMTIEGRFFWAFGDSQPAIDVGASASFSNKGIDVAVSDTGNAKIFNNPVKELSAYLYPGKSLKGAHIGFDTDPLNEIFSREFGKLSSALNHEVQKLWQDYQDAFSDFSSVFADVESIRKKLPPALKVIIENTPAEIHKRINHEIDHYWPDFMPGKKAAKEKATKVADRQAKKPLANLSDLRTKIPKADSDKLKQGLLSYVNSALRMKSITISLKDISTIFPNKKVSIQILQQSQIDMLEEAKKYIPQIPDKRKVSDAAWQMHYLRGKLKEFVDDIARSIQPPRLVELSAATELAKDSPPEVTAHVTVVYKNPQNPFEKSIKVNLKNLSDSLSLIARLFADSTQPTPPDPPPPPQPS